MTMPSASARPSAVQSKLLLVAPSPRMDAEVAAYADGLRKALSAVTPVETVSPSALRSLGGGLPIYHLKNDPCYEPIYQAALARPGVVVLHEVVLHRLLLGCLSEEQYLEEFVFNYGEWLRPLAIEMWNERFTVQPGGRYFEFPMLRRLAEASHAIVVHNPKAHRIVQEALAGSASNTQVFEIPHWVEAPENIDQAAVTALRERLQIPQDAVVIGCFGPLRPEIRIRSLLEAVRAVSAPCRLVLAGSFDDPEYETALLPLLQSTPVIRLSYPAGEDRWRLAHLTDIGVSLAHPSAGQTSPAVLRWMAAGKPVIVTDGDGHSSFPTASVVRVDSGEPETEMLAHYLYALASDKEMRDVIGAEARRHVLQNHSLEDAASRYDAAMQEFTAA